MATLTPNLKLIIEDDTTSNSKANLNKIDTLGGSTLVDNTGNLRVRSKQDITIVPNSNDIGGTGSGGSVTIGESGNNITSLTVNADSFQLGSNNVVTDNLSENRIDIGNSSSVRTATDTSSVGDILADSTNGLTLKAGAVVDADINSSAAITLSKLAAVTASRALESDGSGVITASSITSTELGYLSGVTSNIQTQINALGGANQTVATWSNADGTSKTITHNFGTRNVAVQVLDQNDEYINVEVNSIKRPNDNDVILTSNEAPATNWSVLVFQIGS